METIVIASKTWKPQKKDPSKTYLNIKDATGRYLSAFDYSVGMALDKFPEGSAVEVETKQNGRWWNITAVGGVSIAPPTPVPTSATENGQPDWDSIRYEKKTSIESQNALACLVTICTSEHTPKKERDEIRKEIVPILRSRVSNGTTLNKGGNPPPAQENARTPESDGSEGTSEDNPIIDEAVRVFMQFDDEMKFNSLKSLAKEMVGNDDEKMIEAVEQIERHIKAGTSHNLYRKYKIKKEELKGEETIPF